MRDRALEFRSRDFSAVGRTRDDGVVRLLMSIIVGAVVAVSIVATGR